MAGPAQSVVGFLLFVPFVFLIGLTNHADVDELGPVGVLGTFTAHVNDTVAERAPGAADDCHAALLEGLQLTVAAGNEIAGHAREERAAVHTAARFNRLNDGNNTGVVAGSGNDDVQGGDVFVLTHEVVDSGLLVDGQNAVLEGVLFAKDNIFNV